MPNELCVENEVHVIESPRLRLLEYRSSRSSCIALSAETLSANGCTTIVGIVRAITSCGNAVVVVVDVSVGATVVDVGVIDVEVVDVVVGRVVVVVVVVTGVIEVDASAVAPVLIALSALTRNKYNVSLISPVTVALSDVDTPSLNTDHVAEPDTEYSTT